jgi:hypothetical protein
VPRKAYTARERRGHTPDNAPRMLVHGRGCSVVTTLSGGPVPQDHRFGAAIAAAGPIRQLTSLDSLETNAVTRYQPRSATTNDAIVDADVCACRKGWVECWFDEAQGRVLLQLGRKSELRRHSTAGPGVGLTALEASSCTRSTDGQAERPTDLNSQTRCQHRELAEQTCATLLRVIFADHEDPTILIGYPAEL